MEILRILGQFAKNQGTVSTPKAKIVFDCMVYLHIPGGIGAVVQITLRVLIKDIDSRWRFLVVEGQDRKYRLQAASTAQKVAGHRLSGVN